MTSEKETADEDVSVKAESDIFQDEAIRHAADFKDPPSVGLHLLVKNGESVIERLLELASVRLPCGIATSTTAS